MKNIQKNILIAVAVIILIILGVFLVKQNKATAPTIQNGGEENINVVAEEKVINSIDFVETVKNTDNTVEIPITLNTTEGKTYAGFAITISNLPEEIESVDAELTGVISSWILIDSNIIFNKETRTVTVQVSGNKENPYVQGDNQPIMNIRLKHSKPLTSSIVRISGESVNNQFQSETLEVQDITILD